MLHLKVSGMTCEHCVRAITEAVRAVPGVEDVSVDLARGDVTVVGTPSARAVRDAIAEEGYTIEGAA
ncbi:MAG: heavy-metal-associated domain-containing protein [Acetobacteraceae bacterium]|nr:heavy-metal-associated domain-containing protein [Acetobacteraceae bacterium]